ncbi:MAG: hypothetical protein ACMUIA_02430, partial [bacterium]
MSRKLMVILITVSALFLSSASASTNLSFEGYLSGWSVDYIEDAVTGTTHEFVCGIVDGSGSDGQKCLRLGAKVVGAEDGKFNATQTIVWSGPYDLTQTEAILVDMRAIQRSEPSPDAWCCWGMEATLVISSDDGITKSRAMLWNYHAEVPWLPPYYKPGPEDNCYDSVVIGE